MTDVQFTAILTAIGTAAAVIGAALRWTVGRITKALDDNTASAREHSLAQIALAKEMAILTTKINDVTDWVQDHTPVNQPMPMPPARKTPARGVALSEYAVHRPRTRGEEE